MAEASGSAPLNTQAKADIDASLTKARAEDLSGAPKPTEEIVGGLAIEGMENDPRFGTIKEDITGHWEALYGSRYDENGRLRGDYQNFVFGNPADLGQGKKPPTLEDRAKQKFREQFPDDAKLYDEQESRRIYEDPSQDPAVKAIQDEALKLTNTDSEVLQTRTTYDEIWRKINHREAGRLAGDFIRKYPEKATAYRDKFPALQQALERQSAQQQAQAETSQPKRLENDPDFRNFMDDPQSGLNARIWAGVSVDQGLTSAQYLQRAEALRPQILAEFAGKHPDIYAKYEQEGTTGGLVDPTAKPEQQFDLYNPASLLVMDSISIDDLFKLDYEESYNYMRRLINHHDAKIASKAQRIMSVLDSAREGKENFIKNNQGVTTITLTP